MMNRPTEIPTRIRSLDGIRAFAILTVILTHLQQRFLLLPFAIPASDGVELFFVLSGFLITGMLLREQDRDGRIGLARFYTRRFVRIVPPLLVYLAAIAIMYVLMHRRVPWPDIAGASLFISNLWPHTAAYPTEHLWSLAVEEQFYLLWPPLLIGCLHYGGRRLLGRVSVLVIVLSPLFRIGLGLMHSPYLAHRQGILLPGRMDSLFAGCLLAVWIGSAGFERSYLRVKRFWWVAPVFFLFVSPLLRTALGNVYTFTIGYTLESLVAAYFMVWVIRSPESRTSRALSFRPIAFLGVTSYSTYLYQSPILHNWPHFAGRGNPALALAAALLAGVASFYLVETPMFWLRSRAGKPGPGEAPPSSEHEQLRGGMSSVII